MPSLPVFDITVLEKLCQVLGESMTGSQMTPLLARVGAPDPGEGLTKWRRLAQALNDCQRQHGVGNHVIKFINAAMEPVRFVGDLHRFEELRGDVNRVLAFAGYTLGTDGKVRHAEMVNSLAEAEQRAGRLRSELSRRRVHPDVLKACRAELLQDNYFHAVLEATKSVAEKIRQRTGLTTDGHKLVDD